MCVSEYIEGGLKQSAGVVCPLKAVLLVKTDLNGKLNERMASSIKEVPAVQKRSRNFVRYFCWMTSQVLGWDGRSIALYFILGK